MKTAEERWRENFMSHLIFSDTIIPIIEQIQLDAFKAGEEHAAKIDQHFHFPMQDKPINAPSAKAILADAKERKELPK